MKSKKYMYMALGGLLLVGALVLESPQAPAQSIPAVRPPQEVNIKQINGGAIPGSNVPISGNVGILGTPTVSAAQSGNWNVGITGTVPVSGDVGILGTPTVGAAQNGQWNVGITNNSVSNPLHVQEGAENTIPYQGDGLIRIPQGSSFGYSAMSEPLPVGYRLVIEYVSAWVHLPTGQKPVVSVKIAPNDGSGVALAYLPMGAPIAIISPFDPLGADEYVGANLIRIYGLPAANERRVIAALSRWPTDGEARLHMTFSGYLIPDVNAR